MTETKKSIWKRNNDNQNEGSEEEREKESGPNGVAILPIGLSILSDTAEKHNYM